MRSELETRYDERIAGVLNCYDRVVITGTFPTVCYADGMTRFLHASGIRIFEYPDFASELRDRVRAVAASVAEAAGVTIEHIAKSHIRKESVVAKVLEQRGDHPGQDSRFQVYPNLARSFRRAATSSCGMNKKLLVYWPIRSWSGFCIDGSKLAILCTRPSRKKNAE